MVGNLRLKFEVKVHEIKGLNGGFQLLNLMSSQECEVTWVQVGIGVCFVNHMICFCPFWKSYLYFLKPSLSRLVMFALSIPNDLVGVGFV